MNKNIFIVGAIAAGLYMLSQEKKTVKAVAKKKAPRRQIRKYLKPHPYIKKPKVKKTIAKKKAVYNKPKIKRVLAKKKAIYNKPKIKKAATKKIITIKPTKPWKKKMNKNFHHIPVKHRPFWLRPKPKRR